MVSSWPENPSQKLGKWFTKKISVNYFSKHFTPLLSLSLCSLSLSPNEPLFSPSRPLVAQPPQPRTGLSSHNPLGLSLATDLEIAPITDLHGCDPSQIWTLSILYIFDLADLLVLSLSSLPICWFLAYARRFSFLFGSFFFFLFDFPC
jgi:hypothetical protein